MTDGLTGAANPFLRYRERLESYRPVSDGKLSDDAFVQVILALDAAVAQVEGRPDRPGFTATPLLDGAYLAATTGLETELWIKAEPGNVAGSHKARHLFGTAIDLAVTELVEGPSGDGGRLAIASCGNAALAAGVVAAALNRPLDVYVPTWADDGIVARLTELGAEVNRCPRVEGEAGDPAFLRFREAVAAGARSFSVQGTDTPTTFDGGRTLGWEIADQLLERSGRGPEAGDALYIQVGGGALATATSLALPEAALYPVQAEGCAPLRRAWDLLTPDFDFDGAAADPDAYMWPWEDEPHSLATGILDDVTYDWLPLLRLTHATGGEPVVTPEPVVVEAHRLAQAHTDVPVCATGSAGFAGLLHQMAIGRMDHRRTILVFSGIDRT